METVAIYLTSMTLGGAQRIARNLCAGLVDKGYAVDMVLVDAYGELLNELPEGASVIDLSSNRVATSCIPLARYLRRRQPDVLYSMMTECNVIATVSHKLARSDARLIVSEHNTPTVSASTWKDRFVLRLVPHTYSHADHVVTVSEGVRDDLQTLINLPLSDISVVYNPIAVEDIRVQAKEPLDDPCFHDDTLDVVLSAGRHAPQKGFDTLLQAIARINNEQTRLVLLGKGPETDSLRALVNDLDLTKQVKFTGFVDNPFKYMANADVFVLSSWYEGFGNVLIEAMATGCPVVSTDCPSGPREILDNGAYGSLVPVKDPQQMAESIEDVLSRQSDHNSVITRANEFSIPRITEQYASLFFEGKEITNEG